MLLFINGRLIDFKEDYANDIFIRDKDTGNPIFMLRKEPKGYIFRDANQNPYRPHFKTMGQAINNALSNDCEVYQNGKKINSTIISINPKFLLDAEIKTNNSKDFNKD